MKNFYATFNEYFPSPAESRAQELFLILHEGPYHEEKVLQLIEEGVDASGEKAAWFLTELSLYGSRTALYALLNKIGVDVNIQSKFGDYALTNAVRNGNLDAVKTLQERGARGDALHNGQNIFQLAASCEDKMMADLVARLYPKEKAEFDRTPTKPSTKTA